MSTLPRPLIQGEARPAYRKDCRISCGEMKDQRDPPALDERCHCESAEPRVWRRGRERWSAMRNPRLHLRVTAPAWGVAGDPSPRCAPTTQPPPGLRRLWMTVQNFALRRLIFQSSENPSRSSSQVMERIRQPPGVSTSWKLLIPRVTNAVPRREPLFWYLLSRCARCPHTCVW